jgi:FtsH-binding integral membrane protein
MLRVYNIMAAGIALTGFITYLVPNYFPQFIVSVDSSGQYAFTFYPLIAMVAAIVMSMVLSVRIHKMSIQSAQLMFFGYAALMGLGISGIVAQYTGESVVEVFMITTVSFLTLSIIGYTTKKDLSAMGSFLLMALVGVILAGIVNMFVGSSMLHLGITVLGVLIFAGLTAYDTQKIKELYLEGYSQDTNMRLAVIGALELYLDFINMFLMLLRLLGDRD